MIDLVHLDENYRLLYNVHGIFLQRKKENPRLKQRKPRWSTVSRHQSEQEAARAWIIDKKQPWY